MLLALCLVNGRVSVDPTAPKGQSHELAIGVGFSSRWHLNPFGQPAASTPRTDGTVTIADTFLLAPSSFPALALLILVQLGAFRAFALRRYEGSDA